MGKLKPVIGWGVIVCILLVWLECLLRFQQWLGPVYDLSFKGASLEWVSDVVNHKPAPFEVATLVDKKIYGAYAGTQYTMSYSAQGVRQNAKRAITSKKQQTSILFMGDSFIQGYGDDHTLPQHVWQFFQKQGRQLTIYNAGFSSYSPSIFIPQAKNLIPLLKPDYVVVDIDETDFGDDFIRYQHLIQRDDAGKNIGVKATPLNYQFNAGLIAIRQQPLYLVRLFQKIYFTRYYMPKLEQKYRTDKRHVLSFAADHEDNLQQKYSAEIALFRRNVDELAVTLSELMGGHERVIFIHHPHLHHVLVDESGKYWNNLVATVMADVATQHHILFYDAVNDLKQAFANDPQAYYWTGDMHFNFIGLKTYADHVAHYLQQKLFSN